MKQLIFDKWIDHDGAGCPVPAGYVVDVEGHGVTGISGHKTFRCECDEAAWDWKYFGDEFSNGTICAKITRYKIHKPKAVEAINKLLADLPADTKFEVV